MKTASRRGIETSRRSLEHIKSEIRIVAWDDCGHKKTDKEVLLVAPVFRGGSFIDGMLSAKIKKDSLDSTDKIASAINKSGHKGQLSVIMLDGITFGGFNLVDIKKLSKKTKLPVIVILKKYPDMRKFRKTIQKIFKKDWKKRILIVENAGKIRKFRDIHYQVAGISEDQAEKILRLTCIRSHIPEPVRVAHLIASGLS